MTGLTLRQEISEIAEALNGLVPPVHGTDLKIPSEECAITSFKSDVVGFVFTANYGKDRVVITPGNVLPSQCGDDALKIPPITVETVGDLRCYQLGKRIVEWLEKRE